MLTSKLDADIDTLILSSCHENPFTGSQTQADICLRDRGAASRTGVRIALFARVRESRACLYRIKTYEELTAAGIPCTVVLDSAVAYVMDKVDFVLVGSEAVVESGGLVNAVGSNQMAVIAKAENKPFYALAERCGTSSFSSSL